ncbi:MAG: hypothetical protein J6L89_06960, partial [Clostridia bacterium]|nr:hypothetical protein [Clostridia bacterium]
IYCAIKTEQRLPCLKGGGFFVLAQKRRRDIITLISLNFFAISPSQNLRFCQPPLGKGAIFNFSLDTYKL